MIDLRDATAAVTRALRPWVSHPTNEFLGTQCAIEAARNIVAALADGEAEPHPTIRTMLKHRMTNNWVRIGDVDAATRCAAAAWWRSVGRLAIAC